MIGQPKEHKGPIEIKSLSSKSPMILANELNSACEELKLQSLKVIIIIINFCTFDHFLLNYLILIKFIINSFKNRSLITPTEFYQMILIC